jgi:enoyl-CoA hydratase/carnithine racemase
MEDAESRTTILDLERIDLNLNGAQFGLVTLDRADEMNPLDWAAIRALTNAFDELAADGDVRVIGVTGRGKAFSAGGDMKKYRSLQRDPAEFPQFLTEFHELIETMAQHPKPYLALVNGTAVAGGLELILACDVAFAAKSARIGDAHQPFGQMGGGGVLTLLTHYVGPARARELLFTGTMLPADEALRYGLVTKTVPDDDLLAAGVEFAEEVARKSPLAIANAKRVANAVFWEGVAISQGLRVEREATMRYCLTSEDALIGLDAFAAKERPKFVGR